MSWMDQESDTCECGADVAAYVLGALDSGETEAFRAHLRSCVVCRDELDAFQQAVEILPMGVAQHEAPERLRRRVLEAVAREPRSAAGVESKHRPRPRWAGLRIRRPALALGAVAMILAIAVTGIVIGTSQTSKTHVYSAHVTGAGRAELTVSGGHGELIVHHFASPPAGEIYEVWLGRPGRPPMPTTALFGVTATGDADVEVPGSLRGVRVVMVTPEPAGGTTKPTHPPVILAQLS
jgi:anti-sigma-K factor RskA